MARGSGRTCSLTASTTMLGDDRLGGAEQVDDGQMLPALDQALDGPDQPQKEHRHLLSLLEWESVPEHTRRGLGVGTYTADRVSDSHTRITAFSTG